MFRRGAVVFEDEPSSSSRGKSGGVFGGAGYRLGKYCIVKYLYFLYAHLSYAMNSSFILCNRLAVFHSGLLTFMTGILMISLYIKMMMFDFSVIL